MLRRGESSCQFLRSSWPSDGLKARLEDSLVEIRPFKQSSTPFLRSRIGILNEVLGSMIINELNYLFPLVNNTGLTPISSNSSASSTSSSSGSISW